MKYIVVLGDGMADLPLAELGNKTPLEAAYKPNTDLLAQKSEVGIVQTVPDGLKPASDIANLAVLGYNPKVYYSGRSPLEAMSIGIDFTEADVTYRTNLVTLGGEGEYCDKQMEDYSAGEITTEEARALIASVDSALGTDSCKFYAGISYRHCLLLKNAQTGADLTPPHDISGKRIGDNLPKGVNGALLRGFMEKSYNILKNHPVNLARHSKGLHTADSIWFWGEGRKPALPNFAKKNGVKGAIISAVDLLKGIGLVAGMDVVNVEGATGNIDTNYLGKAEAALAALDKNDFVYIHIEAPDECGHRGEAKNKVQSIEDIDRLVVGTLIKGMSGKDYSLMLLPDHPTPICTRTHSAKPVPYLIYRSNAEKIGVPCYTEAEVAKTGVFLSNGYKLIDKFLNK